MRCACLAPGDCCFTLSARTEAAIAPTASTRSPVFGSRTDGSGPDSQSSSPLGDRFTHPSKPEPQPAYAHRAHRHASEDLPSPSTRTNAPSADVSSFTPARTPDSANTRIRGETRVTVAQVDSSAGATEISYLTLDVPRF